MYTVVVVVVGRREREKERAVKMVAFFRYTLHDVCVADKVGGLVVDEKQWSVCCRKGALSGGELNREILDDAFWDGVRLNKGVVAGRVSARASMQRL